MRKQAKTAARGYGARHQKLRRRWVREVGLGVVLCARCGFLIDPEEPWELDRDDADPTGRSYVGASHRACNRATAAHRAAERRAAERIERWSREW